MKAVLLILVLTFITMLSYAQSDSLKHAITAPILYQKSFWHGTKFFTDGKQISLAEVDAMLMSSPPSANEFKQYKKYKDLTIYSGIATIAFLIVPLITDHFKSVTSTPGKISLGIGYALLIPDVIFAAKRNKHHVRSFNLYNSQFR